MVQHPSAPVGLLANPVPLSWWGLANPILQQGIPPAQAGLLAVLGHCLQSLTAGRPPGERQLWHALHTLLSDERSSLYLVACQPAVWIAETVIVRASDNQASGRSASERHLSVTTGSLRSCMKAPAGALVVVIGGTGAQSGLQKTSSWFLSRC